MVIIGYEIVNEKSNATPMVLNAHKVCGFVIARTGLPGQLTENIEYRKTLGIARIAGFTTLCFSSG